MRATLLHLQPKRKRHERLKVRLRLAGSSLAQIARELGVQPTTVTSVCLGNSRSRRIEEHIANTLATTPGKLWPERYFAPDKVTHGGHMK